MRGVCIALWGVTLAILAHSPAANASVMFWYPLCAIGAAVISVIVAGFEGRE